MPRMPSPALAEARMPRMRRDGRARAGRRDGASMRPRRECLGCVHDVLLERLGQRCFNEAEARMPRMRTNDVVGHSSVTRLQ